MFKIIGMSSDEIFALKVEDINWLLTADEIVYIAKVLNSFWAYDYEAAKHGRFGKHAELKSLRHSDGFFISRILLKEPNIRAIMANQLAMRFILQFNEHGLPKPDWIVGIPDGATELGKDVANLMGVQYAEMKKEDGRIVMVSKMEPGETLLLVEDFCTRGTGFTEAVRDIVSKNPAAKFVPLELVIINRGGLNEIVVDGAGAFNIVAAANHRINDWDPIECSLCKMGSVAIKPKATDENWRDITTSQLA